MKTLRVVIIVFAAMLGVALIVPTVQQVSALTSGQSISVSAATKKKAVRKPVKKKTTKKVVKKTTKASGGGPAPLAPPCMVGKCILVSLSYQVLQAYDNGNLVMSSSVSTGIKGHATPTGTFGIYGKTRSQKMSGPGYYLPNVPYILWFKGDYSLHGTYWHHNFGHPMSHGCVNLPTPFAESLFNWADVGTQVTIVR